MSTSKAAVDRNQKTLMELVAMPGNDVCADCKNKAPRWASHNLGIFICVHCASVHRKIGTHVTKVKSLTLDSWTKEQVETMKNIGNVRSNRLYNPREDRHPPPVNFEDSERDSELEKYIRSKYEHKRFMDRSATVAAHLGPSQSKASLAATGGLLVRPKTAPLKSSSPDPGPSKSTQPSPAAPSPSTSGLTVPKREHRSASATLPESPALSFVSNPQTQRPATATQPFTTMLSGAFSTGLTPPVRSNTFAAPMQNQIPSFASPVFNDLFTLQGPAPATNSTLPLQYQSPIGVNTPPTPFSQTHAMGGFGGAPAPVSQPTGVPFGGLGSTSLPSGNPYANLTANGMGISPGFQPGLRSASFPVFSTQPTGMGLGQPTPTNPYQFALQPTAVNPYGAVQPTQSYSPVPFQPSYSPQPTPPPFTQQATVPSQSPSFFPNFGTYTPQPQQQPAPVFNTQSGTPMSHHAQQAQQLFQNMQGGNNPFSSQNWA